MSRSGSGVLSVEPPTVELEAAIAGRRSVRDYTAEAVDEGTIRQLIDAAIRAPSATNAQPWSFVVVRDQDLLDRLSEASKAHMLVDLPPLLENERRRARLADPEFHIFYHAPVLILISGIASRPWVVEDCALAAENLMLAAFGRGLGSCWIGYAQRYLATESGKSLLGLPPDCLPVAPLIVGHPVSFPAPTSREEPEIRWLG